jgi:large subunit ribosomal protein L24
MKIHTGDTVVVISGKDKGKQGTVLRVLESKNRVIVEGANMRTRHIKKTQNQAGQRVTYEASLHASNVMIIDPKTKKPSRIGYKVDAKTGKKMRIALASGEAISKVAAAKAAKPAKKSEKADKKEDAAKPAGAPAAKTPFWKRGAKGDKNDTGSGSSGSDGGANVIQTAHRAQGG